MHTSEHRQTFVVPVGPQHPALKEPGHFEFTVEGEVDPATGMIADFGKLKEIVGAQVRGSSGTMRPLLSLDDTRSGARHMAFADNLKQLPSIAHLAELQLIDASGAVVATIENPVFFDNRKEEICSRTFGTFSTKHPAAAVIMAQGEFLVSGAKMNFHKRIQFHDGIDQFRLTPSEIS